MNIYKCLNNFNSLVSLGARSWPVFSGLRRFSPFSTSSIAFLKEIHVKEVNENLTVVEGVYVKSPREDLLVKTGHEEKKVCPLCALNLNLKHTDVLILSQFLRSDGCMLPSRITGLCDRQQSLVSNLVAMAQKAGLMPNIAPVTSKKDPMRRYGTKKLHRFFDETTLDMYKAKYPKKKEKVLPTNYHLYLEKYHKKCWGTGRRHERDIGNTF